MSAAWKCFWFESHHVINLQCKTVGGTKPCRREHCEVATLRTRTEVSYAHAKRTAENRKGTCGYPVKYFRAIWFPLA
jgi:hypothetical protein